MTDLPTQTSLPSPEKPSLQVQKYDPGILVQVALEWHGLNSVHSLISTNKKYDIRKV